MVNFPSTLPVGSAAVPVRKSTVRRVTESTAAEKREAAAVDRRRRKDRRSRRGAGKWVMDRRTGADRRRSSIDLSI